MENIGKKLLNIKCVFWFSVQLFFLNIYNLRRIPRCVFINVHTSAHNVPVILAGYSWNLDFLYKFTTKFTNTKFYENLTSGAGLFHADGRTDMKKLIVAFFAILRTRLKTNSFGQLRDCYISAGIFLYSNYVEVSVDDDDFKHKTRKTQRQLCVYAFWDLTAI